MSLHIDIDAISCLLLARYAAMRATYVERGALFCHAAICHAAVYATYYAALSAALPPAASAIMALFCCYAAFAYAIIDTPSRGALRRCHATYMLPRALFSRFLLPLLCRAAAPPTPRYYYVA